MYENFPVSSHSSNSIENVTPFQLRESWKCHPNQQHIPLPLLQVTTFWKKVHVAGCHLDLGTTTQKYTMIRLYVADLQYKPWPFCSINQFCTYTSKPGYPLQFWSPDLTLCLTKASIKIMMSLKIIIHVIIIINHASMKLQMKF